MHRLSNYNDFDEDNDNDNHEDKGKDNDKQLLTLGDLVRELRYSRSSRPNLSLKFLQYGVIF